MNGTHDMGGMHGFGPIMPETDEPAFHETWEGRMFGLLRAMTKPPGFTIDRFRFLQESMPPVAYLTWSYYEHWYFATAKSLLEAGMVTIEELRTGRLAVGRSKRNDAMRPADVDRAIKTGGKSARSIDTPRRFSAGQAVTARNLNPTGHTRLPRYARGKRGVVHRWHGAHIFADSTRVVTANVLSTSTPSCLLHGRCGAVMPRRPTRSIWTSGRATKIHPEPSQFDEPWQAEALALSMALMQAGRFSSAEWATSLGAAISRAHAADDRDDGSSYYDHVLDALEQLVVEKAMATQDALAARKEAWREAYARTPHGQPVLLDGP